MRILVLSVLLAFFSGCALFDKGKAKIGESKDVVVSKLTENQVTLLDETGIKLTLKTDRVVDEKASLWFMADMDPGTCSKATLSWDGTFAGKSSIAPNAGGKWGQPQSIELGVSTNSNARAMIISVVCEGRDKKPNPTACKGGTKESLYCRRTGKFTFRAKVVISDPSLATFRQWVSGQQCNESIMLKGGQWQDMHECMPL